LAGDDATRGLGYDTNTSKLVVATRTGGIGLYIVDANTGAAAGQLSTSGMITSGGTFGVDQGVGADDGAVYSGTVMVGASQAFVLTRWSAVDTNVTPTTAFQGDPGGNVGFTGDRWGDTMAVRGSGAGTQILIADRNGNGYGTNVVLFTTSDG